MGWTDITDPQIDADSPINETLVAAVRDNIEYNFDHAMRCGTHATGVRRVFACGKTAINETMGAATHEFSITVTFSTDSEDGDPNFATGYPIVTIAFEENTSSAIDWLTDNVMFHGFVRSGSLSESGFIVDIRVESNTSFPSSLKGYMHWTAYGIHDTGE